MLLIDYKKAIDTDMKHAMKQRVIWDEKAKEAKQNLEYWQHQVESIASVNLRLLNQNVPQAFLVDNISSCGDCDAQKSECECN